MESWGVTDSRDVPRPLQGVAASGPLAVGMGNWDILGKVKKSLIFIA
jgi:hypothetical protein